jgi:hypothetical protein
MPAMERVGGLFNPPSLGVMVNANKAAIAVTVLDCHRITRLLEDAFLARVVANEVADGDGSRKDADAENGSDRHGGDEVAARHLIEFGISQ